MNAIEPPIQNLSAGIPVNNLWLLMLYASEFRYLIEEYGGTESIDEDVASLVADIFCSLVEARLKRNLTYGYKCSTRELNRVRGRINILQTYSQRLLQKGKVSCTFEELSIDTPRNRYICAALRHIAGLVNKKFLKLRCYMLARLMLEQGVSPLFDKSYDPKSERLARHDADRKVLTTAELAFNLALVNESAANSQYVSPDKQAEWVRKLFEKAVGGFYDLKLDKSWNVKTGKRLHWQIDETSEKSERLMPSMQLDIMLENEIYQQRMVIDTKYTSITTTRFHGGESFKSGHIYQLYAYLRSQEIQSDPLSLTSTGMLLHPSVGVSYNEFVSIQGHDLRFCTVDLSLTPYEISQHMMNLLPY